MPSPEEREELRERIDRWFELPLLLATLVLVLLLVIEATEAVEPPWNRWIERLGLGIWALFLVEFAVRVWLSRDRGHYVRTHWLDALAVALPAFRVFRVFRVTRAFRSIRAIRLLVFGSRGADELIERLHKRKLGKLIVVTSFATLIGASLLFLAENGAEGTPILTFGDALYWSVMMVVGTEGGLALGTTGGRVVSLLLVTYSVGVFSYLIAAVASLWIDADRADREGRATAEDRPDGTGSP